MIKIDNTPRTTIINSSINYKIKSKDLYKSFVISALVTSSNEYLASLVWIGQDFENDIKIYQPGFIVSGEMPSRYLAYDGRVNYTGSSELILMPSSGEIYPIHTGSVYYFNNENPEVNDARYSLTTNNKSIRMNNISIFNSDFSKGIMMDFRSSMEGVLDSETEDGFVPILATIDESN